MIHACNPTSLRHTIYKAQKGHHHNVLFVHVLQDEAVAARVQTLLSTPRFRCYRTTDVTGVELGGALKNVLAIACGELHLRTRTLRPCMHAPFGLTTLYVLHNASSVMVWDRCLSNSVICCSTNSHSLAAPVHTPVDACRLLPLASLILAPLPLSYVIIRHQ